MVPSPAAHDRPAPRRRPHLSVEPVPCVGDGGCRARGRLRHHRPRPRHRVPPPCPPAAADRRPRGAGGRRGPRAGSAERRPRTGGPAQVRRGPRAQAGLGRRRVPPAPARRTPAADDRAGGGRLSRRPLRGPPHRRAGLRRERLHVERGQPLRPPQRPAVLRRPLQRLHLQRALPAGRSGAQAGYGLRRRRPGDHPVRLRRPHQPGQGAAGRRTRRRGPAAALPVLPAGVLRRHPAAGGHRPVGAGRPVHHAGGGRIPRHQRQPALQLRDGQQPAAVQPHGRGDQLSADHERGARRRRADPPRRAAAGTPSRTTTAA